jgi:hypothetical protein
MISIPLPGQAIPVIDGIVRRCDTAGTDTMVSDVVEQLGGGAPGN